MDFKACIGILNSDKAFDRLTQTEKETVLKDVAEEVKRLRLENKEDDMGVAIDRFIKNREGEKSIDAIIQQRNQLLNIEANRKHKSIMENFTNKFEGIMARLTGTIRMRTSGSNSIDFLQKQGAMEKQGILVKMLEDAGLWEVYMSKKIDRDIFIESWELHPGGNPGVSGNKNAEKIASILAEVMGDDMARLNRWGAWITPRRGGLIRQSWDPYTMQKYKYAEWYRDMMKEVDIDETFRNAGVVAGKEDQFWLGVYRNLTAGAHLKFDGPSDLIESGFTGSGNLAKRLSTAHRIIVFKDADAAYRMNLKYANKSLSEIINMGMVHNHRNLGLMQTMSTNPKMTLKNWINDALDDASKRLDKDPDNKVLRKEVRDLKQAQTSEEGPLWNRFKVITGETDIPGNITGAGFVHAVMNIQNMAKLGGAWVTSWADAPNIARELAFHGVDTMNSYGKMLETLTFGMDVGNRKLFSRLVGVGLDAKMGNIIARFNTNDHIPGQWSKMQQFFFKANNLIFWTDSGDKSIGSVLATWFAHNLDNFNYRDMDPDLKRAINQHGILENEFNILQKAVKEYKMSNGTKYRMLETQGIRGLTDDLVNIYLNKINNKTDKQFSKSKIARTRDELAGKYMTYIRHAVDRGVPKPGGDERAIMQRGTKAGSVLGGALRFLWQFKGFPLKVLRGPLARDTYGRGAETLNEALLKGKGDLMGLAHLILAMSIMGYASLSAMDLLRGKETRKFKANDMGHNIKLIMASMAKGGGLGLYGDFLFGQFNRYGRSPTHTLLGPTLGQFDDFWHLYSMAFQQGDFKGALNQMLRIVHGNTPFINLFYLRMFLDYFILYNLMELQNPGSTKRMETNMKRNNNQQFYISPSRVIPRGGTLNIGEIINNMGSEINR